MRRGTNASHTARNISEVFYEDVANERIVCRWFEKFQCGGLTLKNQSRGRHETNVNEDVLETVVEVD